MRNYLISLGILVAVYFLHNYGMDGAYARLWWFDIMTHGLVSAGIAFGISAFYSSVFPHFAHRAAAVIVLTFTVGFMWEGLEAYYNITGHPLWSNEYYFDTIKDIIVDTLAAVAVTYIVRKEPVGRIVSKPL